MTSIKCSHSEPSSKILSGIIKKFNILFLKWTVRNQMSWLDRTAIGQLLLLSNISFICQKEKDRAKVSKAPSCSPCQQYDGNVSCKWDVQCRTHTNTHAHTHTHTWQCSHQVNRKCPPLSSVCIAFVLLIYVLLKGKILYPAANILMMW